MAQKQEDLLIMTREIITLLHLQGFSINCSKLALILSQDIQFLGFVMNFVTMTLSLPEHSEGKQKTVTVRDRQQHHRQSFRLLCSSE